MPKFIVKCQQYVEEVAEVEVEAETYQDAVKQVIDDDFDVDWSDGNDSYEPEVYLVTEGGVTVWDRNWTVDPDHGEDDPQ